MLNFVLKVNSFRGPKALFPFVLCGPHFAVYLIDSLYFDLINLANLFKVSVFINKHHLSYYYQMNMESAARIPFIHSQSCTNSS